jgi:ATP-dependent RNA circularization protein (DNA/RNA ligase family)
MSDLKKELEEIFNDVEFSEEEKELNKKFVELGESKINELIRINNEIQSEDNMESIIYNLHKIYKQTIEDQNDDQKDT